MSLLLCNFLKINDPFLSLRFIVISNLAFNNILLKKSKVNDLLIVRFSKYGLPPAFGWIIILSPSTAAVIAAEILE